METSDLQVLIDKVDLLSDCIYSFFIVFLFCFVLWAAYDSSR